MLLPQKYTSISWTQFLEAKALEFKLTPAQTKVFLTRFDQENWLNKVENIWKLSDVNSFESFVKHSTNIYKIFKPYCPDISQGAGNFTIVRDWLLQEFNNFQSVEHLHKEPKHIPLPVEAECYQTILQLGALIRIKSPSKMGKSRLLNNILTYANQQEFLTVHINLLQIETSKFSSLKQFLRWFCVYITDALKLKLNLDDWWNEDRGSMLSCTRYLEMILQQTKQPLVLGLDDVDRLLNYPDLSQDFFYLLRSWHEEANIDEQWEQLRLVVVYSTEDFATLDINKSPFNVGLPIELQPFTQQQIEDLAIIYQVKLFDNEIKLIIKMLGGYPYLVDSLFSYFANNSQVSLSELLQQAATDTGIYNSYLRQHLINLKSNDQLVRVFLEILNNPNPIQVDTLLAYQLYRMGLIQWSKDGNSVLSSCELYKLYFLPRLTTVNSHQSSIINLIMFDFYKVGGSLRYGHPTYITRQADRDIYDALKKQEFCYVLNSRQMGKSSLRVRTMKTLSQDGFKCVAIDLGILGRFTTAEQWYGGLLAELWRRLRLTKGIDDDLKWWRSHLELSPVQRFSRFIEDILLTNCTTKIIIFIDEVDNIINLDFRDEFFILIRNCYEKRVESEQYSRLTFCLLGVATPSNLRIDKQLSPFNIGKAIRLTGFDFTEAQPLIAGLNSKFSESKIILKEILHWTNGQPFLTQKLCSLIVRYEDRERTNIQKLIQHRLIDNWEIQDEPEHLKTIRDRLLHSQQNKARFLTLYQSILQQQGIAINGSDEQVELRLSGLALFCHSPKTFVISKF